MGREPEQSRGGAGRLTNRIAGSPNGMLGCGAIDFMVNANKSLDAVIVGGGPAGLAAAIALRQRGLACMVVDARVPPIDKACGEGLMPGALESLARLDVGISPSEGAPFRGIGFLNREHRVEAEFPQGVGTGVRRWYLHQRMVERAEELGVHLRWGASAEMRLGQPLRVNGAEAKARWTIGADGQSSRFRAWSGLDAIKSESRRYGFRRHYRIAPWREVVEVHWGAEEKGIRGQIYVTPVGPDEVCVVFITNDPRLRLDQALAHFPYVAAKLRGAETSSRERGCVSTTRTLREVYRGRHVLLGDASGSADAITGEGLATSFRQSLALAEAIEKDDPSAYQAAHRKIARRPQLMARTILLMDKFRWMQERAMRVFAAEPDEFARMLAMHGGEDRMARFAFRHGPRIALKLLAGRGPEPEADDLQTVDTLLA